MASKVVAVAGGTGKLGHAIVDELVSHGGYKVLVLGREANEEKSNELGAQILAIDYSNVDSIVKVLETNNVDTLVSTLSSMSGAEPELVLIQAAEKSKTTKRYIPSLWGIRYTPEVVAIFPFAGPKIAFLQALEASSLEYTAVINGFFLDYFGFPAIKSYLGSMCIGVDIASNAAAIPGSGEVPVVFTYSFDIGRFTAALLAEAKWEKESVIIGDKVTWNEFVAIAEDVKGTKFDVKKDDVGKLEKGEVTELPSQRAMYPYFPKEMLQGMCATFGLLYEKGFFDLKAEGSLNQKFPDVKPKTVRDIVEEAWRGK